MKAPQHLDVETVTEAIDFKSDFIRLCIAFIDFNSYGIHITPFSDHSKLSVPLNAFETKIKLKSFMSPVRLLFIVCPQMYEFRKNYRRWIKARPWSNFQL